MITRRLMACSVATMGCAGIRGFTCITALSGLLLLPLVGGQQETPSIEQLALEVKNIRAELTQVRLELETGRAARLENDQAAAAKTRQRLQTYERSTYEEVASVDRPRSAPSWSSRAKTWLKRRETDE